MSASDTKASSCAFDWPPIGSWMTCPSVRYRSIDATCDGCKNCRAVFHARLRLLRASDRSPSRDVIPLSKKVAERPTVDAVTEFLLVEADGAAIQWRENPIAKMPVVPHVDDDASDRSVYHLGLWRGLVPVPSGL
jgi:hypothetical protein